MSLVKRTRFVKNVENPNGTTITEDVEIDLTATEAASTALIAERVDQEAAAAQYGPFKTALKNAIVQALADLQQEEDRADSVQTQAAAVETAVATLLTTINGTAHLTGSPSAAVLRAGIETLRDWVTTVATQLHNSQGLAQHMQDAALGAKRNIARTRQIIKLVCSQAGIPVPNGGP